MRIESPSSGGIGPQYEDIVNKPPELRHRSHQVRGQGCEARPAQSLAEPETTKGTESFRRECPPAKRLEQIIVSHSLTEMQVYRIS
jgi:hypothetical protein